MINKKIFFIINFLFVFLFSACSINLKGLDKLAGEQLFEKKASSSPAAVETEENAVEKKSLEDYGYKDLTKEHKDAIDEWLAKNGYNRYGDSAGVIYAGGSPLFDEAGGETIDRFEYIMAKHPRLLQQLFAN